MDHGVWLAAFIDITEELKRRAALDGLKEELAHFSRISMLGEMSASVAHELGQPLSSISISAMAATRFLERDVPDVAAALDAITRISSQAGRARDVMDRIRGMAARRVTNAVTVPVVDLVRDRCNSSGTNWRGERSPGPSIFQTCRSTFRWTRSRSSRSW
jgi:C4-dicarboxylate-specific signal transduction histidine kinase